MTVDAVANVVGYDDYYPYGMVMPTRSSASSSEDARYKFTSKERDAETTYDYFGARYYDSRIGRWLSVDPMATARPGLSPYNYCQNNPIIRIDPDGFTDITINVQRTTETQKSTTGFFTVSNSSNNRSMQGFTLELPNRNNQNRVSRINADDYSASLSTSSGKGEVIRLENKNNREGVLIHSGNTANDTQGCILVGNSKSEDRVGDSKDAKNNLIEYVSGIMEQDKASGEKTTIHVIVEDPKKANENFPYIYLDEPSNPVK